MENGTEIVVALPMASVTSFAIGATLGLMSFCGLILYAIFFTAVISSAELYTSPYFILASGVGFCDCVFLTITLFYSSPAMVLQRQICKIVRFAKHCSE